MEVGMTVAGWIFLSVAWAFIFGLTFWCFRRIFGNPASFEKNRPE